MSAINYTTLTRFMAPSMVITYLARSSHSHRIHTIIVLRNWPHVIVLGLKNFQQKKCNIVLYTHLYHTHLDFPQRTQSHQGNAGFLNRFKIMSRTFNRSIYIFKNKKIKNYYLKKKLCMTELYTPI